MSVLRGFQAAAVNRNAVYGFPFPHHRTSLTTPSLIYISSCLLSVSLTLAAMGYPEMSESINLFPGDLTADPPVQVCEQSVEAVR